MLNLEELYKGIKTEAARLGFNHMGVAPIHPVPHYQEFINWVEAGHHAGMTYLARQDTLKKRADPRQILEGCQRIICLAMPYKPPQAPLDECPPGRGRISNYAATQDYHQVIWAKLSQLEAFIQANTPEEAQIKSYVDTGPILERSYAAAAGIGIAGKNSCLLIQGTGSYFFLAEILTDLELPVDKPFTRDLCGTCRRCIDACPTGCIRDDHTIDARRCISYLTIENKAEIPDNLKGQVGDWLFGCDVCQIVCPHNAWTPEQNIVLNERLLPEHIDLLGLLSFDEKSFAAKFGQTPLSRAKRRGLLRNAAVILGNQRVNQALPVLQQALEREEDPAIQDACRWAIQSIKSVE